jgi:hypothetical protein
MLPNTRTGSVRVCFTDGKERTLPIHGLGQLHLFNILDEIGVKDWSELTGNPISLQAIRAMFKVTALALSFPGQEAWTVGKIQNTFADSEQLVKVFTASMALSNLPQVSHSIKPVKGRETPGAYS